MNVADVLTYGHEMVLRATDGLAEPDWLTPGVCGAWTVKASLRISRRSSS
jgi:hypothetical protein